MDNESSLNNNFTAGTINLSVLNAPYSTDLVFPQGIKPGDSCYEYEIINNVGSLPGNLSMSLQNLSETDIATKFYPNGNPSGALGNDLQMALWIDTMHNGPTFISGDILLQPSGTFINNTSSLTYYSPFNYNNTQWTQIITMNNTDSYDVYRTWSLPYIVGNEVQGDSLIFDINYTLNQTSPIYCQ
jgi:hypothetical protein